MLDNATGLIKLDYLEYAGALTLLANITLSEINSAEPSDNFWTKSFHKIGSFFHEVGNIVEVLAKIVADEITG